MRERMLKRSMEEMRELASRLFEIVSNMPPKELLGYIYAQRALSAMFAMQDAEGAAAWAQRIDSDQFLLEYIHGILASSNVDTGIVFDETKADAVFEIAEKLRSSAMTFAIASSNSRDQGIFGSKTGEIEFRAKSGWVLLRGHRYQVLEQVLVSAQK